MSAFRTWWGAMPTIIALACAGAAPAAPALTTIQDVLYKADGSRFNGTLVFTWNNFQSSDNVPIPTQGITVNVVNGYLKVKLVPTTTASAGASYSVKYSSGGSYQFTETWAVPSSSYVLRVKDVRTSTGVTVGSSTGSSTASSSTTIAISDVTGLTAALAALAPMGTAYTLSRTAVINSSGMIDGATGNLTDCVHVDGSSGSCGSSSSSTTTVAYADNETPTGTANGSNTVFTLSYTPSPSASLKIYRNGLLMKQATDYSLSGTTVTFVSDSVPQTDDVMTAFYRYSSTSSTTASFADNETPSGTLDGSNTTFTLGESPSPVSSLALFRNGLFLRQGTDYTLSGNTITFTATIPQSGDVLSAFYRY